MIPISTVTVGSGGASAIEFTNIPQNYTDLKVVLSGRTTSGFVGNIVDTAVLYFNTNVSDVTNYTAKSLYGSGSAASSDSTKRGGFVTGTSATASTFGTVEFYIPNYTSTTSKSVSIDGVSENNATGAYAGIQAWLWSLTSPVTSIALKPESGGNWQQYSSATLYGIRKY